MTKSFAKLSTWLSAFAVLLCTAALAGDLKVTYEIVQPCVPGVTGYSQAVIDLYVTTGTENFLTNLTAFLAPIEGVTIDPTKVEWNSATIVSTTAKCTATTNNGRLRLMIQNSVGAKSIEASANAQYLCRVYADVDSALAGEAVSLPFTFQNATGVNVTTSAGANFRDWLSDDSIDSVDFNVYQSFNFFLATGATFETDEDVALTISATDTTKFEATAWDTATSTLKPTSDVAFTGTPTLDPAEAGAIAVQSGALVFTPAENWSGAVVVSATAKSTTIADTDTDVNFPITVNPVDDPLVEVSCDSNLHGTESYPLDGNVFFEFKDVDGGKFITSDATLTVTLSGSQTFEVSGTVEHGQPNAEGVTAYTFMPAATPEIPYTAVIHPESSGEFGWSLALTDTATESYTLEGTMPVKDVDRPPAITSFEVNGTSTFPLEIKADTVALVNLLTGEDPDEEDTVGFDFYKVDRTTNPWSYTLYAEDVASFENKLTQDFMPWRKDTETCFAVRANSSYGGGFNETTIDFSFKCVNSAPVVPTDNGSVFVLRHEDKSTPDPGVATFTATDADGNDDLLLCAEPTRAATPAADTEIDLEGFYGDAHVAIVNGDITFTYTVKPATVETNMDTEETLTFYVTDTDEEDFIPVTVKCTFQANPPPVLASASGETGLTVSEVDEAGNPTAFELTVNATDTNVYPAGVGSWAITVPDGWSYEVVSQDTGSVDAGTWEGSATWTITTAGYDTITGSPRDESGNFGVTVSAFDVTTGAEATLDFTITVNDVDRLPSAPATVALEPTEPVHGDAIVATPSGATDEDGDEITGYTYAWAYKADGESFIDLAETTNTLNDAEAIKKGYTVKVTAFAVTKPYSNVDLLALSAEGTEAIVLVGNTAPFMSTLGDQTAADATINLEYTWTVTENSEDNTMAAAATDVDVEDGVDSLTYAVSEIAENVGTLAIDEATGEITFTPAADYNTVETGDTVTFTVTATDESGAAAENTATVTLVITEVNTAPSLTIEDQYVMPPLGVEQTVTATAEMGEGEENQKISEASIEVLSGAEIFSVAPAVAFEDKTVTITYTIAEDAELTAPAELKVTIKDDGTTAGVPDPQSAEATFKIFLGGSPWYPSIAFECVDPDAHTEGHTVVIDGSDGSSYSITLKGATYEVKPADYVAIGHPGYAPNTELEATVYVWTQKGGTSKEVCAEAEATVADYVEPGEATATADPEVGENGWVTLPTVSVPMAQSYTVTVTDENGKTTQTIGPVDFEPNEEGMILPNIEGLKIQLPESGSYTISVTGENPAGTGETTELFDVDITEDSEVELVWSEGSFTPENGAVLTSESVKFSWPIASGAKSYTLTVYNADGTKAATKSGVSGTSQTLTLKMKAGEATPYTWSVSATSGKKSILSDEFSFTLCESTDSVIITKVAVGADGLAIGYEGTLDEGITISFDYQYFDVSAMKWNNGTVTATVNADNTMTADLSGVDIAADDYVVLQLKVNGKKQGDWVVYQVQEAL